MPNLSNFSCPVTTSSYILPPQETVEGLIDVPELEVEHVIDIPKLEVQCIIDAMSPVYNGVPETVFVIIKCESQFLIWGGAGGMRVGAANHVQERQRMKSQQFRSAERQPQQPL